MFFVVFIVCTLTAGRGNFLDELSQLPYTFGERAKRLMSGFSKKFVMPVTVDYNFADNGYDLCCLEGPLSKTIFKKNFNFSNIYLFAKLSEDNKIHILQDPTPQGNRVDVVGPNLPFGAYKDDLYTALLAPTQVNIEAFQNEFVVLLNIVRQGFDLWGNIKGLGGVSIPIKRRTYSMNLSFCGGHLSEQVFCPTATLRENSMYQFFKDYESVDDFFMREIIDRKNMRFEPYQAKVGFGDILLFLAAELAPLSRHIDSWQVGFDITCPSGGRYVGDKVWELMLGNGGAWQPELFTNLILKTPMSQVNPLVRGAVQVSIPFTCKFRIPKKISNVMKTQVKDVPGLIAPANFSQYWVEPFEEFDDSVPWFTDCAPFTRIQWGKRVVVGLGNYVYDLFQEGSRLAIIYDFVYNANDSYSVVSQAGVSQVYDPSPLESETKKKIHRLSWNWSYIFDMGGQITVGSQHVIAGYNSFKSNDIFVIWTMVF